METKKKDRVYTLQVKLLRKYLFEYIFLSIFIFYVSKLILIIALKNAANCKENLFRRYLLLTYFFTYVFIYLLTYEIDGETDFC